MKKIFLVGLVVATFSLSLGASVVFANHSWGGYHWVSDGTVFALNVGDNVSSNWDLHLASATLDWSASPELDTIVVPGAAKRNCQPVFGRVEVCNSKYGRNGWLGVAQVWVDSKGHIFQGVVKMNDTYFNGASYNTSAWRNMVMCQEIGHTLGLDHQDEIFNNPNLGTCMDYTNSPLTNQHPNQHDYDQLAAIYSHSDGLVIPSTGTLPHGNGAQVDLNDPSTWGKSLRKDGNGNNSLFGLDLGKGGKLFTFVTWAE